MCCNYCYHFNDCKKAKKIKKSCCKSCAEYEYCPFVLNKTADQDDDSFTEGTESAEVHESETDVDIFDEDEEL